MPLVIGVTKEFAVSSGVCCACPRCSQEISGSWSIVDAQVVLRFSGLFP